MTKREDMELVDELYEQLSRAIEEVRQGLSLSAAREIENRFLAKLAFLALRRLASRQQQQALIASALMDYAKTTVSKH